jgi:transcriptional regulator
MELLKPNSTEMATAVDIFAQHAFATVLVNKNNADMPQICHLPILYDEAEHCFHAHCSANNPIVPLINEGHTQTTLIFIGEHGYVSPTWSEHIRVPTWDYCVIHVTGQMLIIDNPDEKHQSMVEQVAANETDWKIGALDDNSKSRLLKAIKVIRVDIDAMRYRYKMSQAKHADAKAAIVDRFEGKGKIGLVERYKAMFAAATTGR